MVPISSCGTPEMRLQRTTQHATLHDKRCYAACAAAAAAATSEENFDWLGNCSFLLHACVGLVLTIEQERWVDAPNSFPSISFISISSVFYLPDTCRFVPCIVLRLPCLAGSLWQKWCWVSELKRQLVTSFFGWQ